MLHQRLKNHLHRAIIGAEKDCPAEASRPANPLNLDYLIIIDFEATCREDCPDDWLYEIIEFPAILLNVHTLKVVSLSVICEIAGSLLTLMWPCGHCDICYMSHVHVNVVPWLVKHVDNVVTRLNC